MLAIQYTLWHTSNVILKVLLVINYNVYTGNASLSNPPPPPPPPTKKKKKKKRDQGQ